MSRLRYTGILLMIIGCLYFLLPDYGTMKEEETITVEVRGEVKEEKVITLEKGSSFSDALEEIELTEDADITSFSLQETLYPDQVIVIPKKKEEGKISINIATEEELMSLPGIGPVIAGRILEYRKEHGSFHRLEDLMEVKGIGEKTYAKLQDLICL